MYAVIVAHPWLSARAKVQHFHKRIFDLQTGLMYTALSREVKTKMGLSPSFAFTTNKGKAPTMSFTPVWIAPWAHAKARLSTQAVDATYAYSGQETKEGLFLVIR
jgi:uncharacterized RmlC-like cupin family protein